MLITILTQYYPPEIGAPQVRLASLAGEFRRRGHGVRVVTAMPNYPTGRVFPGYRKKWFYREELDGIPVTRTWIYPATGRRVLARLANYLSFAFSCLPALLWEPPGDVLLVESPPLFLGLSGWFASILKGERFCLNISDLWPDSVVALGIMKEGFFVRAALQLEKWLYRRAWLVCAVTRGILEVLALEKGVVPQKLVFFPNGADLDLFHRQVADEKYKRELGLDGKKLFGYVGTHGYAQGLDVILGAAKEIRDRSDIGFLLVGDGPEKKRLQKEARDLGLGNVVFLDSKPVTQMPHLFSLLTGSIVPLRDTSLFRGARPSKMYPLMSCGVPLIYCGRGEGVELVRSAKCGLDVPPEDPKALAGAVLYLADHFGEAAEMGSRGREFVEREYSWPTIVDRWLRETGLEHDPNAELDRIREEYARRAADGRLAELYSPANPANQFLIEGRERAISGMLRDEGFTPPANLRVLDLGCGSGYDLRRFISYGFSPLGLHGLDLLWDRLDVARQMVPPLRYVQGDGGHLPYRDGFFDLVVQSTVFSSVLDDALKAGMAGEMMRVLRPGGMVLWYDFWLNPTNLSTRGIRPREIKKLFPGCRYRFRKVTLAPPIARKVVPVSWKVGNMLESLTFLRSHYLAGIVKPGTRGS